MQTAVPKLLRYSLMGLLVVAVVTGFSPLSTGSSLPVTDLLDVWLVLLGVSALRQGRIEYPVILAILSGYLLTRIIPALIDAAPIGEFLRAYRWLLYLLIMVIVIGRSWADDRSLVWMTWFLLAAATLKYVLMTVVASTDRPVLFLENNFEIPLFFGLVIITYGQLGKWRPIALLLAGVVALLSESRSGILAFGCLVIFAFLSSPGRFRLMKVLYVAIPASAAVAVYVFDSRSAENVTMDRVKFFDIFKHNADDWHPLTWMFGTKPLTPLDAWSCANLQYYKPLIYSPEYDTCYSVILHSFGMRVIYDAGILGLLLAFGVPLFAMIKSGVDKRVTFALLAIAATNALSVSSLNNPYVALPIFLAILHAGANSATNSQQPPPIANNATPNPARIPTESR